MRLTTPERVRTLQRKLYCKAKQDPAYRFYSLYDKIHRADILSHAYDLVRSNKGSAGIDGMTFEAIEAGEGVSAFLAELKEALREKTYKPSPVKRVLIPKPDGTKRPLGIPTIQDRVAQMAVKLVIEPIFEADFATVPTGSDPVGAPTTRWTMYRTPFARVTQQSLMPIYRSILTPSLMPAF